MPRSQGPDGYRNQPGWLSRLRARRSRLPIPTLRKLAREGVIAASMRPVNPTVTWPNHTAIVTGVDASEHRVLYNGLLALPEAMATQPKIEPWRDKEVMVHAPTIYDVAHQAGLTTAQVDWVAIYRAKTSPGNFPNCRTRMARSNTN